MLPLQNETQHVFPSTSFFLLIMYVRRRHSPSSDGNGESYVPILAQQLNLAVNISRVGWRGNKTILRGRDVDRQLPGFHARQIIKT